MTTVAIRKERDYVLRVEKMYISGVRKVRDMLTQGGGHLTLVKTDRSMGTRGMSLFLVLPKKVSGVSFTQLEEWGRRDIHGWVFPG